MEHDRPQPVLSPQISQPTKIYARVKGPEFPNRVTITAVQPREQLSTTIGIFIAKKQGRCLRYRTAMSTTKEWDTFHLILCTWYTVTKNEKMPSVAAVVP